jgi:hypothetical protein
VEHADMQESQVTGYVVPWRAESFERQGVVAGDRE